MTARYWKAVSTFFLTAFFFSQPLFVFAAGEAEAAPEWVLSYFLVLLCVGLSILILLRPSKRSESAFSQEELDKMREEDLKKMTGKHT